LRWHARDWSLGRPEQIKYMGPRRGVRNQGDARRGGRAQAARVSAPYTHTSSINHWSIIPRACLCLRALESGGAPKVEPDHRIECGHETLEVNIPYRDTACSRLASS